MPLPPEIDDIFCQVTVSGQASNKVEMTGPGSDARLCYDNRRHRPAIFCNDFIDGSSQGVVQVKEIDPNDIAFIKVRISQNGIKKGSEITKRISTVREFKQKLKKDNIIDMAPDQMALINEENGKQLKDDTRSLGYYDVKNTTRILVTGGRNKGG